MGLKKTSKKKSPIVYIVLVIILLAICKTSGTSDETASNDAVETTTATTSITTTTELTTITTTEKITTTEESTTTMPTVITVAKGYENKNNPLMNKTVETSIIPNSTNDTRGYIEISKEDFSKVTEKNYLEFCRNVVYKDSESYNYFTIYFGDGTGICYSGCYIFDASYGTLDDTGAVKEKLGSIRIDIQSNKISSDTFTFAEDETVETTQSTAIETTQDTTITTVMTTTERETEPTEVAETVPVTNSNSYVLNTSTRKFHRPSCSDVDKISAENYATFEGSRDDLMAQGYDRCGHCNP